MKIKNRLLLLLVPAIFVSLALLSGLSYLNANRQAKELAHEEAQRIAYAQSSIIFDKLRDAEAVASSLAVSLLEMREHGNIGREVLSLLVKGAIASSPDFFGIWMLWQANAYDGRDAGFVGNEELGNDIGRANAYWLRRPNGELGYDLSDNYDDDPYYVQPMERKKITIIPPYRDKDTEEKTLMSTIAVPIMDKGKFLGAVGIDIEMDFIQDLVKTIKPYDTGYALLISDTGAIVADPSRKEAAEELPQVPADVLANIKKGQPFTLTAESIFDKSAVQCFYTPVKLESFDAPWYFMVALPIDKVMAESNRNLLIQLGISLAALAVLVWLVFYTANGVSRPLQHIVEYAKAVASGDHTSPLESKGLALELQELYNALRTMLDSLLDTMHQVEKSSAESAKGAEQARKAMAEAEEARRHTEASRQAMLEVAARVDAVSDRVLGASEALSDIITVAGNEAKEQNRLMEETSTSIGAMSESIVRVSSNAEDAADFAEQTRARAGEGAAIVNRTLDAIDGIRRETEVLGAQIADLSKNTEAVGAILGLINDIADQTNLLALNAAIEAARAGEAGRGFAVVADEVRKLAEKTMEATRQVDESISGIRNSMRISAEGVARTAETVCSTVNLGHEAQASLQDIVGFVQGMTEQIHDIAKLCREQAATSEQVADVMERLSQLSENVDKAMHQGAEVSRALGPEAKELGALVTTQRGKISCSSKDRHDAMCTSSFAVIRKEGWLLHQ